MAEDDPIPREAFLTAGALITAALRRDEEELESLTSDMSPEEHHQAQTALLALSADAFTALAQMQARDPVEYTRDRVARLVAGAGESQGGADDSGSGA